MAYIHPKYHVPTKAIAGQAIWAGILCLSGTFKALYEFVVFGLVIFFAATGFAVIVLRYKRKEQKRPYKTWGYPVTPVLLVLMNIAIFINTITAEPLKSLIGLSFLLIGIPAFFYWKKKKKNSF